jgi:hypothetical protein
MDEKKFWLVVYFEKDTGDLYVETMFGSIQQIVADWDKGTIQSIVRQ